MSEMKPYDPNQQTALDMAIARSRTSITVENVRNFLHRGYNTWETRRKILDILERDSVFDKSQRQFMNRTQKYEHGLSMTNRIFELEIIHNWSDLETKTAFALLDEQLPIALHNHAVQPVFMLQAGPTLLEKYGSLISTRGILGCYLQTELGHGTGVSQLETTATFLPLTQEFEIHSPTLTSSKWWIGGLGKTSTHGVLQAKLILPGGKDPGSSVVNLYLDDHKPLPGITIGDIGPKACDGYSSTDNGFARFNRVRIPKENMFSQFAQVTSEGEYIQPPHAKLSYGGMLYMRATMVTGGGWSIAKAATVAIRYATVRRQGERGLDGLEKQIISYPSVYYRLLPILSRAYVFIQLGTTLMSSFETMANRLLNNDTSLLAEMHATTSGLKVLVTNSGVQDIETARRSMGGHGYSAFAGLGRLYADYLPSVTYEGDNFVLDQQVVRSALKSYRNLFSTSPPSLSSLSAFSDYLRLLFTPPALNVSLDFTDPNISIVLLELRAALIVQDYAKNITVGKNPETDASADQRVSKAVTEAFVAVQVAGMIKALEEAGVKGHDANIVRKVYLLYLLTTVEAALVDLLSFGVIIRPTAIHGEELSPSYSKDPTRALRLAIQRSCLELIPESIGLTDAFGFTDWDLDSALGVYNGKVYEALWERVQAEPLNRTEVSAAYEASIKHILQRGQRLATTATRSAGAKL